MMTLAQAKIEVARVAGGSGDMNKLALAASALAATAKKWSNKHNWEYLRTDNALSYTISQCDLADTVVRMVAGTTTAGINVGQSVTGAGFSAGHTVASIESSTALTITSSGITSSNIDLVFGAYIPVLVGVSYYYLPHDFKELYSARLLTSKRWLEVVRDREIDRENPDQESNTDVTVISPASPGLGRGFTASDQRPRCRLYGPPSTAENLLIKYYRAIDGTADPIDVPDDMIYAFIDDAKAWFLAQLNSADPRMDFITGLAARGLAAAIDADRTVPDEMVRMKSQMEVMHSRINERGYPLRDY